MLKISHKQEIKGNNVEFYLKTFSMENYSKANGECYESNYS